MGWGWGGARGLGVWQGVSLFNALGTFPLRKESTVLKCFYGRLSLSSRAWLLSGFESAEGPGQASARPRLALQSWLRRLIKLLAEYKGQTHL